MNLLMFDGFGIKHHSFFILLFLKVLISFLLHFVTFLDEKHDKHNILFPQVQDKHLK